jgi:hypothetical protein
MSEDGGEGYPITDGGDEYTDAVAEVPYLVEAVQAFVSDNWDVLQEAGVEAGQCGHDLILTANGHGAGFWDRGLGAAGWRLTEAARGYSFEAEFQLDADGDPTWLVVENVVIVDTIGMAMADTPVSEAELQEIWSMRPVYNGMTHVELHKRYGDRVYHVPGDGWYVRPGNG